MPIDHGGLEREAARRGLSLSRLAAEAGISRATMARIKRGVPVRAEVAARLEKALARIPEMARVRLVEPGL